MFRERGFILPFTLLFLHLLLTIVLLTSANYVSKLSYYHSMEKIYSDKAQQLWIVYTEKNKLK
ncbi:hypothetical protein CF394_04570 [Tetzosporium hominis]|uniref:Uncharacterized protein n=1 Tax=Tetzosporium hominis TaxID=2020506 RepID=A0A264W5E4_9BACL|nr:hypothetical protein CF394_04570 [Tetzosporium hominis]